MSSQPASFQSVRVQRVGIQLCIITAASIIVCVITLFIIQPGGNRHQYTAYNPVSPSLESNCTGNHSPDCIIQLSWQLNEYDEIYLTRSPNNELYNKSLEIKYDLSSTFDEYLDSYAL